MSSLNQNGRPSLVIIASAGMGHLIPSCRLAHALADEGYDISLLYFTPAVSLSESRYMDTFFTNHPGVRPIAFQLELSTDAGDPFFVQFGSIMNAAESVIRSALQSVPHIPALIVDVSFASTYLSAAARSNLRSFVFFPSSAMMLTLCAYLPVHQESRPSAGAGDVCIPGLRTIPKDMIPAALHDPNHIFTKQFLENGRSLGKAAGILINSSEILETDTMPFLHSKRTPFKCPPVISIGPSPPPPRNVERKSTHLRWLDEQPACSVLYICFGNRTAMSQSQILELAHGLDWSGCRFMWVVKSSVVDKDDHLNLNEVLGEDFLNRIQGKGLLLQEWVQQQEILKHDSIYGFMSHCGWGSVCEAVISGVPMLAWPCMGDQRVNADVVQRSGFGMWNQDWKWEVEKNLVSREEICDSIKSFSSSTQLRSRAKQMSEHSHSISAKGSPFQRLAELMAQDDSC